MSKVAVVTDSTANILPEMVRGLPILTIPLQVIFGEESFLDGVTITPDEFYLKLKTCKDLPTTSQPTPAAFIKIYRQLLAEGYDILSIHLSAQLSGTLDSALQAKQSLPEAHIEVVDSKLTAMALGFQVLAAARAAVEGASLMECKSLAEKAREHGGAMFVVDTLEYLHRGGRIGGAAAFLGNTFNLKPILDLRDGRIEAVGKVRTKNKAVDFLVEHFVKRVDRHAPIHLAALHAQAPQEAAELLELVRSRFPVSDVSDCLISEISPVLGTHVGPGTVGLAYLTGM